MTPAQAARTQVTVVFLAGFALGAVATILGKRLSELYLTMSYYLYRITIVQAFERLAHADVAAEHMETIVLFLVDGARDDVPNVRFTAVKALETVSLHANDRLVANFIKPVLNELLANDTDADVRNYVKDAIAAL